jgi:hypothetical protein
LLMLGVKGKGATSWQGWQEIASNVVMVKGHRTSGAPFNINAKNLLELTFPVGI